MKLAHGAATQWNKRRDSSTWAVPVRTEWYSNGISGNTDDGIHLSGATTEDNGIERNFIGLAVDEVTPVPNSNGIIIDGGSNDNVIGSPGNGNTIAGNTAMRDGIAIIGECQHRQYHQRKTPSTAMEPRHRPRCHQYPHDQRAPGIPRR